MWTGDEWIPSPPVKQTNTVDTHRKMVTSAQTSISQKDLNIISDKIRVSNYYKSTGISAALFGAYCTFWLTRALFDPATCKTSSELDCTFYSYFRIPIYTSSALHMPLVASFIASCFFISYHCSKISSSISAEEDVPDFIERRTIITYLQVVICSIWISCVLLISMNMGDSDIFPISMSILIMSCVLMLGLIAQK